MATAPPSRHAPRGSPAGGVAMAAGALGALVAALESYRGRDRVVSAAGGRAGGAGRAALRPYGPALTGPFSAGPCAVLWLPTGRRRAGRDAEPRRGAAREPPGCVGPAELLPHRPASAGRLRHAQPQPRLRAGAQGERGPWGAAGGGRQAAGVRVCPCAPRRTRTRWCEGCRCSATWPTSSTTPASTSPGRPTPASSAAAPSAGGPPARRSGGSRCCWAPCGERRPREGPLGSDPRCCSAEMTSVCLLCRSLRILFQLRRKLRQQKRYDSSPWFYACYHPHIFIYSHL